MEIKTSKETEDIANLQKAADFVKAFVLGFEVDDALAMLRLDDLSKPFIRIRASVFHVFARVN